MGNAMSEGNQKSAVPVRLAYRLTGAGWSEGSLSIGKASASFTASYLSDAFGRLVAAVADIQEGKACARFSFDEEPGEFRWLLSRAGDRLTVRLLGFDELWGSEPDELGRVLLDADTSSQHLALAVKHVADELLELHGLDGYHDLWVEAPFPLDAYDRLCRTLWLPRHPACSVKTRKRKRRQMPRHGVA